jgi:hypothetical protein
MISAAEAATLLLALCWRRCSHQDWAYNGSLRAMPPFATLPQL